VPASGFCGRSAIGLVAFSARLIWARPGGPVLQRFGTLSGMIESILIPGPVGGLEAEFARVDDEVAVAVLCHPHPLYGGSMHDGVLAELDRAFAAVAVSTLRFNFRGVGRSEGEHDGGAGEIEDVIAAFRYAATLNPRVFLGGYSFGAAAAVKAALTDAPAGLLLVAPPPALLGTATVPAAVPTRVIVGDRDDFVDVSALEDRFGGAGDGVHVEVLEGADHFFMGAGDSLVAAARAAVGSLVSGRWP